MKNKIKMIIGLVLTMLLFTFCFQNCSNNKYSTTDQSSVDELFVPNPQSEESAVATPNPTPNPIADPTPDLTSNPTPQISDQECFVNYISVYENPNNDPTLSNLIFLKAIKIYDSVFPAEPTGLGGWSISSMLSTEQNGDTKQALRFLKTDQLSSDNLNCYFPIIGEQKNLGLKNSLNTLIGFLSTTSKYIRCHVDKGDQKVLFQSADGENLTLSQNQPFVIKRGCRKY